MGGFAANQPEITLSQVVLRAEGSVCPDCGLTTAHSHDRGVVASTADGTIRFGDTSSKGLLARAFDRIRGVRA